MIEGTPSNYDLMRDAMELEFLKYDQQQMIDKFGLDHDAQYLYIRFVGEDHRIGRSTGMVEAYCEKTDSYSHADYNVSMTIFDVLCYSKPHCCLSGEYASINNLKSLVQIAGSGGNMFARETQFLAGKCDRLRAACETLGGSPQAVGDVAYVLPLFPFLPVVLQFWDADEEFDAVLKIMWDENILDYMHYESTYFATAHLFARLKALCS